MGEWVRYLAAERTRTVTGILDLDSTWLAAKENLFFKNKNRTRAVARFPELDSDWLDAKRSLRRHAHHAR